eukprot:991720-Rhodomonas_salina.1
MQCVWERESESAITCSCPCRRSGPCRRLGPCLCVCVCSVNEGGLARLLLRVGRMVHVVVVGGGRSGCRDAGWWQFEWEIEYGDLEFGKLLGSGTFGD